MKGISSAKWDVSVWFVLLFDSRLCSSHITKSSGLKHKSYICRFRITDWLTAQPHNFSAQPPSSVYFHIFGRFKILPITLFFWSSFPLGSAFSKLSSLLLSSYSDLCVWPNTAGCRGTLAVWFDYVQIKTGDQQPAQPLRLTNNVIYYIFFTFTFICKGVPVLCGNLKKKKHVTWEE